MKTDVVMLKKYEADEGMVFDWGAPHFHTETIDGKEVEIQEHLYAKKIFLSTHDDIANYIEIK